MAPLVYLDTNIFVYLKEGSGARTDALIDLILAGRRSDSAWLATSELTLAELIVKPYVQRRDDLIDQYDNWIVESPWLSVGPVTRDVVWYAGVMRSQYRSVKLPDAIHLATAAGFQCKYFLTADTGLDGKYELTHTRYGLTRGPLTIEVVRPEPSRTRDLITEIEHL